MVEISNIQMYRDGGTIEFNLSGSVLDGRYRLQSARIDSSQPLFRDDIGAPPRPMFRKEAKLIPGGNEEAELLHALKAWLDAEVTENVASRLAELAQLQMWLNLPSRLTDVVPLYRARLVAEVLRLRSSALKTAYNESGNDA